MSGLNPLPIAFITSLALKRPSASAPLIKTSPSLESIFNSVFVSFSILFLLEPFFPIKTAILAFGIFNSFLKFSLYLLLSQSF